MKKKKRNYINNKDLLKEIHESKMSYCYIENEKYKNYVAIISGEEYVNSALFLKIWEEKKETDSNLKLEDIVIRVITYRHIPDDVDENSNGIKKLNFIPFKHFVMENGKIREVVRSHWKGDLKSGHFDMLNGKITDNLAKMIMLMVDRYYMQPNVRGYSYVDDIKAKSILQLVENSLKFDERKSDNAFSYMSNIISNSMKFVINTEKKYHNFKNDLLVTQDPRFDYTFQRQAEHEMQWKTKENEK